MARIWSVITSGARLKVIHSAVMPALPALFRAVRMSCHFLPVNARSASGTTVSSATWTESQPSISAWSRTASPTLYRHGVQACSAQNRANPSTAPPRASG